MVKWYVLDSSAGARVWTTEPTVVPAGREPAHGRPRTTKPEVAANRDWPWSAATSASEAEEVFWHTYPALHAHMAQYRTRSPPAKTRASTGGNSALAPTGTGSTSRR